MYISSYYDRYKDQILVWEKTESGNRIMCKYNSIYNFYIPDPNGSFKSITDVNLSILNFDSKSDFDDACNSHPTRFESDIHPQDKVMMTYINKGIPDLTVGFLDIEVDYDPKIGWPRSANPYAPINAITIYNTSVNAHFTLAVPPPNWSKTLPIDMVDNNYWLFNNERELLESFFYLIADVDILSGWNSDFFDMPYIGKRIEILFGSAALRKLSFDGGPAPRWSEKFRFKGSKEKEIILDLQSRVHLDYMALFKKFTLGGRQSYSLESITEDELDIPKMKYDGTLYELYRNDFEKFIKYNRHDVQCLVDLDKKFKYILLANTMVHEATVNFSAIFGSVQLIDNAIINFSHSKMNRIVFDKKHKASVGVEGALVMSPKVGLHKMIGSVDLASLYPSTYRSLNLSPEKIVGQLLECEDGWRAVYEANINPNNKQLQDKIITIIPEGSSPLDHNGEDLDCGLEITASNMIRFLRDNKYSLSAYGTILDQSCGEGLIPAILTYWFGDRKELQKLKKKHKNIAQSLKDDTNKEEYLENLKLSDYYDMLQGVKKVLLNSLYGATLNEFCRFHDPRLGASTTGTGRQITTHMINTIAKTLLGDNTPLLIKTVKERSKKNEDGSTELQNEYEIDVPIGLGPIYSDTDSCYFSLENIVGSNIDDAILCADGIALSVNDSFQEFMQTAFFCQPNFDNLISANREVVASAGIFKAKKKYILLTDDVEGTRIDVNSPKALKTQGSDIKISSTPKPIREMLKTIILMILKYTNKKEIIDFIIDFRRNFNSSAINPLDYATVISVKNLEIYTEKWTRLEKAGLEKVNLPGNVRASINYNECLFMFNDKESLPIISGAKIKIVWLRENQYNFKSIAFNSDNDSFPYWFSTSFEIDLKTTEQKLIDQKIKNIFEAIGWEVPTEQTLIVNKLLSFDD